MSAAVTRKTVELFYDVLSPFAWIGFEEICRYRSKWNIDLKFRPFLLAGIMKGSGNRPPATLPAKGLYLAKDLKRVAKYHQVPLNQPADFAHVMMVKGSLRAQRFLTAVTIDKPDMVEKISRELWMRIWSRDEDITEPESVAAAAKKAGLSEADINHLLQMSDTENVKEKLKQTTQEALDYGAFGAPTFIIHVNEKEKEMVWGSDRGGIIAQLLGEKYVGPLVELAEAKL